MKTSITFCFFLLFFLPAAVFSGDISVHTYTYKIVNGDTLTINVYYPPGYTEGEKLPAIVFFFGGGFRTGSPAQFTPQSRALASDGMIAMTADYRTESRHGTTPVESLKDAISAMRWIKSNADRLGVKKGKIAAGGGSAGGYLAVATALIKGIEEETDNKSISPVPDALVLFNPAVKLRYGKDGDSRFGSLAKQASPYEHVTPGCPPVLIMHGTNDQAVKFAVVESFCKKMNEAGNHCELEAYPGCTHGFFNYGRDNNKYYDLTLARMKSFLISQGYLHSSSAQN